MSGWAGGNAQDTVGEEGLLSGQRFRAGDTEFGDCLPRSDREDKSMGVSSGTVGEQLEVALVPVRRQEEKEG